MQQRHVQDDELWEPRRLAALWASGERVSFADLARVLAGVAADLWRRLETEGRGAAFQEWPQAETLAVLGGALRKRLSEHYVNTGQGMHPHQYDAEAVTQPDTYRRVPPDVQEAGEGQVSWWRRVLGSVGGAS